MKLNAWISMAFVASFGTAILVSPSVYADKLDQERAREALLKGEVVPLTQALNVVNKEFGGEVVEVELEEERSGFVYEIKVLQPTGKVLEVELDAKTLQILEVED